MRRWVRNRGGQLSALGEIHVHDEDDLKRLKEILKLDAAHPMKKPRSRVGVGLASSRALGGSMADTSAGRLLGHSNSVVRSA
jgi:hypothetical protein